MQPPRASFALSSLGLGLMLIGAGCVVDRMGLAVLDAGGAVDDAEVDAPVALDLGVDAGTCAAETVDLDGDPSNGCECHVRPDVCNGLDDDCDPSTADGSGDPSVGGECDGPDRDRCAEGVFRCEAAMRVCSDLSPDSRETCGNSVDDDCDGMIDEPDDAVDTRVFYPDADGDGHATAIGSVRACSLPAGFLDGPVDDCDDTRATVHTGEVESCDGHDNDCNGIIDDGAAVCPCTFRRRGAHVYLFCAAAVTFPAAEDGCVAAGYHLATIDDGDESAWLQTTARGDRRTEAWWIGLTDQASEGTFAWTSGSSADFRRWRDGEPNDSGGNEDCVDINAWDADAWNDASCDQGHFFVCEAP